MVERELVVLILQVDSPITHGCQLSGPREKHHTEGHYAGSLETKTWREESCEVYTSLKTFRCRIEEMIRVILQKTLIALLNSFMRQ